MRKRFLLVLSGIAIIAVMVNWWLNDDQITGEVADQKPADSPVGVSVSAPPLFDVDLSEVSQADVGTILAQIFTPAPQTGIKQSAQSTQFQKQFFKISSTGQRLNDDAETWHCAESSETGLMWEVKRFDGGLQDNDNKYTWYSGGENGLDQNPGKRDGGVCYFSQCDSQDFVRTANEQRLCGASNWRLPHFSELETLLDREFYSPVINQQIFIHAQPGNYMTSTELETNPAMIMYLNFFNGTSFAGRKDLSYYIRLVRSR